MLLSNLMDCKVYYLFSKNDKIGSKIISWASSILLKELKECPSHMAVLVEFDDSSDSGIIIESTLNTGVRLIPYKNWKEINEELYKIPENSQVSYEKILSLIGSFWGKKYDWGGICYFIPRFLFKVLFNWPFPKKNAWQSDCKYFCNELGGKLAGYEGFSMVTPAKMCFDMLKDLEKRTK